MKEIFYYFERDIRKWSRSRINVFSSLAMPAAWLILVGLTLPIKFTDNYLDFITPSILVMTMLFSSLQGGALMIFDKVLGFLNKFLAMPSPRESILLGKILFISTRGLLQATVILLIATLLGVRIHSPLNIFLVYLTLFLFGVLFSAFSTTLALHISDHDGYAAVNSMISMPLFFASNALMPYDQMPGWLRMLAMVNPLSHTIDSIRELFMGGMPVEGILGLAVAAGVMLWIGVVQFRRTGV
ncbi:MAG TPA: multidrug ABC transporter permease [Methanosarcinaceae archaeon]|nr:multidrug ABC transporter permease [Methanosarcinaceae archaeon]